MCLRISYKKKIRKFFYASLKPLKKGVESGVGSGSAPKCHGSPTLVFKPYGSEGVKKAPKSLQQRSGAGGLQHSPTHTYNTDHTWSTFIADGRSMPPG
jgi:hypothetical protein